MNKHARILLVLFSIFSFVLFSGQRRPTRPQTPPRQPASRASEPKSVEATEPGMPLVALRPDSIFVSLTERGRADAPRNVTLLGDPRKNELYVTRTLLPKGKQVLPHFHHDSRTVVVLSGTYYYGLGERFDASKLVAFPPGSFLTEPAGVPHFTWAQDGDVIVQTTAIGPSGTQLVPDKISSPQEPETQRSEVSGQRRP